MIIVRSEVAFVKVITATELKNNLGKYLEIARSEDVAITKNGVCIAKLCPGTGRYSAGESEFNASFDPAGRLMTLREPTFAGVYNTDETDEWTLSCNGEAVARITPIARKRRLGFIDGPPASEKTIAALFEPILKKDELREWETKPL